MADNYPIGEDAWNRSKEARQHPELVSSGYGTVDLPWSTDEPPAVADEKKEKKQSTEKPDQRNTDVKEHNFCGHTVRHGYPTRSVKRDLNNI